ncbi:unnamed protein product, partial [Rotaria sp. Silwood2]
FETTKKIPYDLMESISSSDDEIMFSQLTPSIERQKNDQTLHINEQEQLISTSTYKTSNSKITSTNENQSTNQQQLEATQSRSELEHPQRTQSIYEHKREHTTQQLSAEERKRIHNRNLQ